MKMISIRRGLPTLLIFQAVAIAIITAVFMVNLYRTYGDLVYSESAEVLNLYAMVADSKLYEIEALSFEILSNGDIHNNLLKYRNAQDSFEAHQAVNGLYTQLFTRWVQGDGVLSMTFVFLDGTRVDVGHRSTDRLYGDHVHDLITDAFERNGSVAWTAEAAQENTVTLYRLIRDISGNNRFRPLGTLFINVDVAHFLNHTAALHQRYRPEILAIAGNHVLSLNSNSASTPFDPDEVLANVRNSGDHGVIRLDEKRYFAAVKGMSSTGWDLIYLLSAQALLQNIFNLTIAYGIALAMVVAIVIAIGYAFASGINSPLIRLTESMKAVEEGDYATPLEEVSLPPRFAVAEVTQLSRGFSRMVQEIDHLINAVYTRQLTIMEMRYRMLRQQINPHFLYNTLDTINWKALQGGNREISMMVTGLSRLLRRAIKGSDMVTVDEELRFVQDYIMIQKFRFEERLEFQVNVPEQVRSSNIPHLTLQPLVENSIVHNLERFSGVLTVSLTAHIVDRRLEIIVADNGRGIDSEHVAKVLRGEIESGQKSIGLRNIDTRIKAGFGDKFGVHVTNRKPHGTMVTITLPWREEQHADRAHSG